MAEKKHVRRSKRASNSRDSIVSAAVRVLADDSKPFDARTVAKEAGKSLGTLSFHFRDGGLRALQGAVAGRGFQRLVRELTHAVEKAEGPEDGLRRLGLTYVRFALQNERLHRVMYGEPWGDLVEPSRSEARSLLKSQIEECRNAGLLKSVPAEDLALAGWALMHGIAVLYLDGQVEEEDLGAAVDRAMDLLLKGASSKR